jgi:hypothetical protein
MVLRQLEKWPGSKRFNASKTKVETLKHNLLNSGFTKQVQVQPTGVAAKLGGGQREEEGEQMHGPAGELLQTGEPYVVPAVCSSVHAYIHCHDSQAASRRLTAALEQLGVFKVSRAFFSYQHLVFYININRLT